MVPTFKELVIQCCGKLCVEQLEFHSRPVVTSSVEEMLINFLSGGLEMISQKK